MRPLNRPMFKYGGPIKEGIMTGMKEKQAINTVGSPLAPKDETGRGGYALPLIPLAFQAARFALAPLGRLAMQKALRSGLVRGAGNTVRGGLGRSRTITPADMTGTKLSFSPNAAGRYFMASPEYKFLTGAGGKASKFVGGALKGLRKSPLGMAVTAGTLTDILPGGKPFGPDKYLPNILGARS